MQRIGPIRETHYGGFYDFVPDLAKKDTAYTNIALDVHTDTTYFSEPAALQAFHMLSHEPPEGQSADGADLGGKSILVDGFNAVKELKKQDMNAYNTLAGTKLPWHASGNKGVSIVPDALYPVLETFADGSIRRIRWNNDDRGIVPDATTDAWFNAARKWVSIIRNPANQYQFNLEPGRVLSKNSTLSGCFSS